MGPLSFMAKHPDFKPRHAGFDPQSGQLCFRMAGKDGIGETKTGARRQNTGERLPVEKDGDN